MKNNPDNRADNVVHLQQHIDNTVKNMRKADEMMRATDNDKTKAELEAKNDRREMALDGFRQEIKDEADYQNRKS
jgi:small acid-soluble spore protein (thioredoxin-like protein)